MRKGLFLIGLGLLLLGVFAESIYVVSSRVAYNGPTLTMDVSMVGGIILIFFGLLLALSSVKIPKIWVPE